MDRSESSVSDGIMYYLGEICSASDGDIVKMPVSMIPHVCKAMRATRVIMRYLHPELGDDEIDKLIAKASQAFFDGGEVSMKSG